jgi:hypothetical protein
MATLNGFDVEQYLVSADVTRSELHNVRSRLLGLHPH